MTNKYKEHFEAYPYEYVDATKFMGIEWLRVSEACKEYERPVREACRDGDIQAIKEIMESGFTFNDINKIYASTPEMYGQIPNTHRPIHSAVRSGKIEMVEYLIKSCNQSVHETGEYHRTPLHYAAIAGDLEMVKYLVQKEADINILDDMEYYPNMLPIHYAAENDRVDIVKFLMEHDAILDTPTCTRNIGVGRYAAENGSMRVMEYIYKDLSDEVRVADLNAVILNAVILNGWNRDTVYEAVRSFVKIGTPIDEIALILAKSRNYNLEDAVGG
jgi:hypothetical protein